MSKSLKNFVSVRDYFQMNSNDNAADDFRMYCFMYKYSSTLHFSMKQIEESRNIRLKIEQFLLSTDSVITNFEAVASRKPTMESRQLATLLDVTKEGVDAALKDDFDTPRALRLLMNLVADGFKYTGIICNRLDAKPPLEPLIAVEDYVINTLHQFGFDVKSFPRRKFGVEETKGRNDRDEIIEHMLTLRMKVRQATIKQMAIVNKLKKRMHEDASDDLSTLKNQLNEVMETCDWVRDKLGPELGIAVEDLGDKFAWRHSRNLGLSTHSSTSIQRRDKL